jgi:hypothetical protein
MTISGASPFTIAAGELWLEGNADFPHHHEIERGAQPARHLEADRHAAAR